MDRVVFIIATVAIVFLVLYIVYFKLKERKQNRIEKEYSEIANRLPPDDSVGPVKIVPKKELVERAEPSFGVADSQELNQASDSAEPQTWEPFYQFNILARANKPFTLQQLRDVFAQEQLVFGEHNVFYKYDTQNGKNQEIFRVGNLIRPGSFPAPADKGKEDWVTRGICVVMFTPSSRVALNRFVATHKFLEAANNVLDGVMCTKDLKPLTDAILETYKNQLIEHDRV